MPTFFADQPVEKAEGTIGVIWKYVAMGEGMPGLDLAAAIEQLAARLGLPHLMSVTWTQCIEAVLATSRDLMKVIGDCGDEYR